MGRGHALHHTGRGDRATLSRTRWPTGLDGIVHKRKDSRYSSSRSPHWIKSKNPACAALKRESEERGLGPEARARMQWIPPLANVARVTMGRSQDIKIQVRYWTAPI